MQVSGHKQEVAMDCLGNQQTVKRIFMMVRQQRRVNHLRCTGVDKPEVGIPEQFVFPFMDIRVVLTCLS